VDRNAVWALFEKTGNIGAYMLYHNMGMSGALDNREAAANADKNRRTDHSRSECR
jgi:hypothetical protein